MKAGDTAYWGMIWNGRPHIEQVEIMALTPGKRGGTADIKVLKTIRAAPHCLISPPARPATVYIETDDSGMFPTLPAALAWIIERASVRLAEQERAVAQTRETLGELRGMLEGVEGVEGVEG